MKKIPRNLVGVTVSDGKHDKRMSRWISKWADESEYLSETRMEKKESGPDWKDKIRETRDSE